MRKLLLLLPVLSLASCSGGHDLMSDKPFRMTCSEDGNDVGVLLINPDLPQATLLRPWSKEMPELTYELAVKTPVRFEIRRKSADGMNHVISINRETAEISEGNVLESVGLIDLDPLYETIKCRFETL